MGARDVNDPRSIYNRWARDSEMMEQRYREKIKQETQKKPSGDKNKKKGK